MTTPVVQGPPARAVGVFRRLAHLVDADTRTLDFRGLRLHVARCGAMCAVVRAPLPARSIRPSGWCSTCTSAPVGLGSALLDAAVRHRSPGQAVHGSDTGS
ncbi:hypothetical protein EDD40_6135 [Saccharothrix texasensis]|uniref:Uncharacterized protein n=1 Tax=Saccharothrix texasensis TaxID=103734 RepID=A0A3N1HDY1_9PSEU|nr:hypothetical protein EDD40_6135 [Saccharothrix texasensis]